MAIEFYFKSSISGMCASSATSMTGSALLASRSLDQESTNATKFCTGESARRATKAPCYSPRICEMVEETPPPVRAHCWGRRMSFNTSSHKISGLRSPALATAMSFVGIACLTPSSHSPVRRAMQSISNATLRNAYSLGRTGGRQGMG
jgi:hypothetical protein